MRGKLLPMPIMRCHKPSLEALMLLPRSFHGLRSLLQAWDRLWGTTGTTLGRLALGVVEALLPPVERLFGLHNGLVGSLLFGGQGGRNRLAQFMLYMEEVRRVMRPKVVFHIRQQARGFITGRWYDRVNKSARSMRSQRWWRSSLPCCFSWITVPTATSFSTLRLGIVMVKDSQVAFWLQSFAGAVPYALAPFARPSGRRGDRGP